MMLEVESEVKGINEAWLYRFALNTMKQDRH